MQAISVERQAELRQLLVEFMLFLQCHGGSPVRLKTAGLTAKPGM